MTLDEIIKELASSAEEEQSDYDKYTKLAAALNEKFPHRGYGCIIKDIADEEMVHLSHIKMMLKDMGADEEDEEVPEADA